MFLVNQRHSRLSLNFISFVIRACLTKNNKICWNFSVIGSKDQSYRATHSGYKGSWTSSCAQQERWAKIGHTTASWFGYNRVSQRYSDKYVWNIWTHVGRKAKICSSWTRLFGKEEAQTWSSPDDARRSVSKAEASTWRSKLFWWWTAAFRRRHENGKANGTKTDHPEGKGNQIIGVKSYFYHRPLH